MHVLLKNAYITAKVNSLGAELCSLQGEKSKREYLWNGNPEYWNRCSPILFPFVGRLLENRYTYKDKQYQMRQHGFARDMEFELVKQTENEVVFMLCDTAETRQIYPFAFRLQVSYRIQNDSIIVGWQVDNPAKDDLFFLIGSHPAFICPLDDDICHIKLGNNSQYQYQQLNEDYLCVDKYHTLTVDKGIWHFSKKIFDNDVYIFPDYQLDNVSLIGNDGKPYLSLYYQAPLTGIWSKPGKNAPFVCVEPWYGRCDRAMTKLPLEKKDYVNKLPGGTTFKTQYEIKLYEM